MNHKWKDNVCVNCGIERTKKDYRQVVSTYSKLGNDGCFHDVPVYRYGKAWCYGRPHELDKDVIVTIGFERPSCKK